MIMKKKRDIWKETHWDRWSFGRKVLHVIAVIASLLISLCMVLVTIYVVLLIFGIEGFISHARDKILLDIMHMIFG